MTKIRIRIKELSAQGKLLLIGGLVVTSAKLNFLLWQFGILILRCLFKFLKRIREVYGHLVNNLEILGRSFQLY